jgi:hypothetical protein
MEGVLSRFTQQLTKRTDESWVVTISPDAIRPIAREPLVTWIEAAPMPRVPENEIIRSAIHVDTVHSVRLTHRPPVYKLEGAGDLDLLIGNVVGDVQVYRYR